MTRERIYVVVRPGRQSGASDVVLRWLRLLLPAAVLLSAPAAMPGDADDEDTIIISVDADDVASGPLSLADAIARARSRPPGSRALRSTWPGR